MNINVNNLAEELAKAWFDENYENTWMEKEVYSDDRRTFIPVPKEHLANTFFNRVEYYQTLISEFQMKD